MKNECFTLPRETAVVCGRGYRTGPLALLVARQWASALDRTLGWRARGTTAFICVFLSGKDSRRIQADKTGRDRQRIAPPKETPTADCCHDKVNKTVGKPSKLCISETTRGTNMTSCSSRKLTHQLPPEPVSVRHFLMALQIVQSALDALIRR